MIPLAPFLPLVLIALLVAELVVSIPLVPVAEVTLLLIAWLGPNAWLILDALPALPPREKTEIQLELRIELIRGGSK